MAAEWLSKAFGFTVQLRIANYRIQMRAGEGCFTVAEGIVVPNHSILVQVRVEDVLRHCELARQAGARILTEPKDLGSELRCYMRDPDGYLIEVGQTV